MSGKNEDDGVKKSPANNTHDIEDTRKQALFEALKKLEINSKDSDMTDIKQDTFLSPPLTPTKQRPLIESPDDFKKVR